MAVMALITPARLRSIPNARAELEAAIEAAIALLDAIDGDPDLEPEEDAEHDGLEPDADLGDPSWPETGAGSQ